MKIMVLIPSSSISKNVVRDLLYGCCCKGKRIAGIKFPPIPQLIITTFLRNLGYEAKLLDTAAQGLSLDFAKQEIINDYDFVIVMASTVTIGEDAFYLNELKKVNSKLKTIVFGSHPTFMPEETLRMAGVDFIILGEAELALKELIETFRKGETSFSKVKGIGYLDEHNEARVNERQPFINNLDDLPIPDRTLLPSEVGYFNPAVKRMPYTTAFTARGCPGRCTFCSSPSFYGKKIRFKSAGSVLEELEIIQKLGYREVFFRDEVFTVSKKRTLEICEGILKKDLDLTWICSARIGSIDRETMKMMKKSGCHLIRFGVESGVQEILDNIKKDIRLEQIEETFKWIHELKLDAHAHLMIGMPGETAETIKQTVKFVKKIDPTIATFGICTPVPGTELFEAVKKSCPQIKDGTQRDFRGLHTEAFYNKLFTQLSNEELAKSIRSVYRSFYLRPSYIFKWLGKMYSLDKIRRVYFAAIQVLDFIFRGDSTKNSLKTQKEGENI